MICETRPVVGYEEKYSVTNQGDVYSHYYGKTIQLKPSTDPCGYKQVVLTGAPKAKCFRVHRLVADAFCPRTDPARNQVNHKDGVKSHNCDTNLEWVTRAENMLHAKANGLIPCSRYRGSHKLTDEKVRQIRQRRAEGASCNTIAEEFNVHPTNIGLICRGKTWAHVPA